MDLEDKGDVCSGNINLGFVIGVEEIRHGDSAKDLGQSHGKI